MLDAESRGLVVERQDQIFMEHEGGVDREAEWRSGDMRCQLRKRTRETMSVAVGMETTNEGPTGWQLESLR